MDQELSDISSTKKKMRNETSKQGDNGSETH